MNAIVERIQWMNWITAHPIHFVLITISRHYINRLCIDRVLIAPIFFAESHCLVMIYKWIFSQAPVTYIWFRFWSIDLIADAIDRSIVETNARARRSDIYRALIILCCVDTDALCTLVAIDTLMWLWQTSNHVDEQIEIDLLLHFTDPVRTHTHKCTPATATDDEATKNETCNNISSAAFMIDLINELKSYIT